jgi:hypothetical protein
LTPFEGTTFAGYFAAGQGTGPPGCELVDPELGPVRCRHRLRQGHPRPQPPHPDAAAYDSGDHLHPNDLGYLVMANSVPLSLFTNE